ncbi:putative U3 small nucleolar RNA-associated protein 11 [Amylocarpus encephaloides]|uniref:U3 small nucleolar RNA-associated protein 11 n=1 Tax=Amylocarpus encephaloides TaxID=45428 RepID=A0A9P7YLR7_9HELO|nr:putative U3 small nucleolar RNA-associated protein 11 [Amylocarpus encephaloides]
MSSMRNAVQRRNHRERGQPEERKKLGLLEKHKDYSLRAADHNLKKRKLKNLKQKVLEKNPDEFYFGMLSRQGPSTMGKNRTGTINGDRGNSVLSLEAVRLLKTQDVGYVRTVRNTARKDVQGLEQQLALIKSSPSNHPTNIDEDDWDRPKTKVKKIVFADAEEMESKVQEAEGELDDLEQDNTNITIEEKAIRKTQRLARVKVEHKLQVARERLKVLTETEQALELQRAGMAKTATVGGVTKKGVKFKVKDRKR